MINNLFLAITLVFSFHDFHITHTTLHYNDESKSMELTVKVAIEDLEKSLENENSNKVIFDMQADNQEHENLINEYISNHLKFSINNKAQEYQWVGKEISNNLHDIYLYFEIPDYSEIENVESITIENLLFLELYSYQTNIVLVELINKNYNLTFTVDNDIQTITTD
ncbi:MAG: DUF6702 family protein [Flavobacteriales bacterium]